MSTKAKPSLILPSKIDAIYNDISNAPIKQKLKSIGKKLVPILQRTNFNFSIKHNHQNNYVFSERIAHAGNHYDKFDCMVHQDLIWNETSTLHLGEVRNLADAIYEKHLNQMLAYKCLTFFNWSSYLDDLTIEKFQ